MIPALALGLSLLLPQQESDLTLTVDRLHVGDGQVLENATVTISGGRITAVVGGGSGDGEGRLSGAELTPGLVDAFSFMGVGSATLEQSRETTASLAVADSANLDAAAFRNAVEAGVTSAYLSPDSLNVFGGIGAFVKTSGGTPADLFAEMGSAARVVDPVAGLKIVLGSDPSRGNFTPRGRFTTSFNQRRPNTRMGTVWIVRRDFYRALDYRARKEAGEALYDRDLEVLVAALEGRIPVRFQARRSHDLQTALRLRDEFDLPNVLLEEATEGHLAAEVIAAAGVPVVCGPAYDAVSRSVASGPNLAELRLLVDPPPVCCEDLHEEFDGVPVGDESEHRELNPVALDLLLTLAPRYGAASGLAPGRRRRHAGAGRTAVCGRRRARARRRGSA